MKRIPLSAADAPRVQRFFDANPLYWQTINGRAPHPTEARDEIDELPPASMNFRSRFVFGWEDAHGEIHAMATGLGDFLAEGVWHIGLFIVGTALHGTGSAHTLYRELEDWMRNQGAQWVRLGAVVGNIRAERFWERMEYVEVRRRQGVDTGGRVNELRVMVKALHDQPLSEYLAAVARDRPGAA